MELISEELKTDTNMQQSFDWRLSKLRWKNPPVTPLGPNHKFNGVCLPAQYKVFANSLRAFKIRPNDIYCFGYPKTGTTWTQEMVWLINNNFDFKKAKKISQLYRFPLIELLAMLPMDMNDLHIFEELDHVPSPRHFKSHLPISMLPEELWTVKPKIIYITRNPKDAAVSLYHHYKHLHGYLGSLDEFLHLYLEGNVIYGPFTTTINEFLQLKGKAAHIHFISYEKMQQDLRSVIRSTAKFLEKPVTEQQVEALYEHLQVDSMRNNPCCNQDDLVYMSSTMFNSPNPDFRYVDTFRCIQVSFDYTRQKYANRYSNILCLFCRFIRRAKVNGFKDEMSDELISKFDDEIIEKMHGLKMYV